jgi:hypothetical protein
LRIICVLTFEHVFFRALVDTVVVVRYSTVSSAVFYLVGFILSGLFDEADAGGRKKIGFKGTQRLRRLSRQMH